MSKDLRFRISSALKSIIGKDLITDDFAAIFELVKNSFDADASKVLVNFNLSQRENSIIISDNGHGMNESDLYEKWLFLAHSTKSNTSTSKSQKTFAGYKGIGRFSCDRLGGTLRIQSKTKRESVVHNLYLDWGEFENDSKIEFKDVSIRYEQLSEFETYGRSKPPRSGVILEIGNLREGETWDRYKLLRLRRALSKLVPPISPLKDKVSIVLECERELTADSSAKEKVSDKKPIPEQVNGPIKNDILSVLEGKTTSLEASVTAKGELEVKLIDRGDLIYRTSESIKSTYSRLIGTRFEFRASFLNTSAKSIFTRRMGIEAVNYGSLFLVRNGFLVYPVGEKDNDYWGLNQRKQQGHSRYLGAREIIGFVSVNGDEESFRESSSRDKGLIKTSASEELSNCVMHCIKKLESYVAGVVWKDNLDSEEETAQRMSIDSNRSKIIGLIEKLSKSKKIKVLEYNKNLVSILDERSEDFNEALVRLKNIATDQSDKQLLKDIRLAETEIRKAKKQVAEETAARIKAQEHAKTSARAAKKSEEEKKQALKKVADERKQKEAAQKAYEDERKYSAFKGALIGNDKEQIIGLQHQIYHSSGRIGTNLKLLLKALGPENLDQRTTKYLKVISLEAAKINSIANYVTKANFNLKASDITREIVEFIVDYIHEIYISNDRIIDIPISISIEIEDHAKKTTKFRPLEVTTLIDILISNAHKAKAKHLDFRFRNTPKHLVIEIEDNGKGIKADQASRIFEMGYSTTNGSGIGLFQASDIVTNSLKGKIELLSGSEKGAKFKITI